MYLNLGHKLKVISKVIFWVLLGAIVLTGAALLVRGLVTGAMSDTLTIAGIALAMVLAPAVAWLFSVPVYVLGHMMENSDIRTDLAIRAAAAQGTINTDFLQAGQSQPKTAYTPYGPSDSSAYYGSTPENSGDYYGANAGGGVSY